MTTIATHLTRDGNSFAVRLPKIVLTMSGLDGDIEMDVQKGEIILRAPRGPRASWKVQIARVAASNPRALIPDEELEDWETTSSDGLSEIR